MTSRIILIIWIAELFVILVSGTSITVCTSQIDGAPCQLICETTDFRQSIIFRKDGNSIGYCFSTGTCGASGTDYAAPHRVGTTQTVLNISAYNRTRDPGEWTCSFGGSLSPSKIMHYAIPPTSVTIASNNFTVNSTTHITVTTACAYINISGIVQFKDGTYNQSRICTEIPSGVCASGTGSKYTCNFTLNPRDMVAGTYKLEFRVDLPYDDTNPLVNFTTPVYVTFPGSLTTTQTTNEIHFTSTVSNQYNYISTASNLKLTPGEIGGIAVGVLIVLSVIAVIVWIIIQKKRSGQINNKKNNPI